MAKKIYVYACHDCKVSWEKEYQWGKPAGKTKCPDCGKRCGQNWLNRESIPVHFKGAGWHAKGGYHHAGSSDEVNLKLQGQSEDRMAGGWKNYAKYDPGEEYIRQAGGRRLNDQELGQKLDAAKKMSDHVYDNAGINPHDKYKGQ